LDLLALVVIKKRSIKRDNPEKMNTGREGKK